MGASANRGGIPASATTTSAGTVGVSAEERAFPATYARPCVVTNTDSTNTLYVKVNTTGASTTSFLVALVALQAVDVSFSGRVNVDSVSLYYAAGAYANALVVGWTI